MVTSFLSNGDQVLLKEGHWLRLGILSGVGHLNIFLRVPNNNLSIVNVATRGKESAITVPLDAYNLKAKKLGWLKFFSKYRRHHSKGWQIRNEPRLSVDLLNSGDGRKVLKMRLPVALQLRSVLGLLSIVYSLESLANNIYQNLNQKINHCKNWETIPDTGIFTCLAGSDSFALGGDCETTNRSLKMDASPSWASCFNPPNGSMSRHGSWRNHALSACRCVTTLLEADSRLLFRQIAPRESKNHERDAWFLFSNATMSTHWAIRRVRYDSRLWSFEIWIPNC